MSKRIEIPDCHYPNEATFIAPSFNTPTHSLYLSNLDTQHSLRPHTLRYVFLYKKPINVEALRSSLSRALVDYYPLAGRLRPVGDDGQGLEIDCNGEGALFAEGSLELTAEEFKEASREPNYSWMKLVYKDVASSYLDAPPLVIQVLHLRCGSMILCTSISHCLCDGVGTAQFLQAWARVTANPDAEQLITPFHDRRTLKHRTPPYVNFSHPEYHIPTSDNSSVTAISQPLLPIILTFTSAQIHHLKKIYSGPSGKCTAFEAVAAHIWCAWIRALDLPPDHKVRLGFSINIRRRSSPELPQGYYANGFVLGSVETSAGTVLPKATHCVELIQQAKERVTDEYIQSLIDLLEDSRVRLNTSTTALTISQWSRLGLEDVDFGEGRPVFIGPQYPPFSHRVCLLLPVVGDLDAVTLWMSFPQSSIVKFESCLKDFF